MRGTVYSVLVPEYPSRESAMCSCPDFGRRGLGTCKHVEASLLWLEEHRAEAAPDPAALDPASVEECWKEIDRQIDRVNSDAHPSPLTVRVPGSILYRRPSRNLGAASGTRLR